MANNNNRSNQSQQYNEDWNQDNRHDQNSYGNTGHGDFGSRQNLGNREGYSGYYNRKNYMPDYDQQHGFGNSGHQNAQSSNYDNQHKYNTGYYDESNQNRFGNRRNYEDDRGLRDWEMRNKNYNTRRTNNDRRETPNRYGGDTSNYGNANQGGYDRNWWDRTKDEVSSWFGGDDKDRRSDDWQSGEHRGKGPKNYQRSEERIREDVCDRLSEDDRVDASNIDIQIQNNEVILSGTVTTKEEKRRAEDLVERVSGVRHVENRLRVNREEGWR